MYGFEDGEYVVVVGKEGDESGVDMKLVDGNVEVGKEEGLVIVMMFVVVMDIEKKRRWVEWFGIDLKIFEVEKCNFRVVRFNYGIKNGVGDEVGKKIGSVKVFVDKSVLVEVKSVLIVVENVKRKVWVEWFGSIF